MKPCCYLDLFFSSVSENNAEEDMALTLCVSAVCEDRHNEQKMIMWFIWIQSSPSWKKKPTCHLFHKSFLKCTSHTIAVIGQLNRTSTDGIILLFCNITQNTCMWCVIGPLYRFYCEILHSFYLWKNKVPKSCCNKNKQIILRTDHFTQIYTALHSGTIPQ